MAKCKYCQETISRLDKEVCPFCGGIKPLEGGDTSTQDVTKVIGQVQGVSEIKHKRRVIAAVLAVVFGFLGLHEFYIGKIKHGIYSLVTSLVAIVGVGCALFFTFWPSAFAFLVPYFIIEAFMLIQATNFIFGHDVTDSKGDFLE